MERISDDFKQTKSIIYYVFARYWLIFCFTVRIVCPSYRSAQTFQKISFFTFRRTIDSFSCFFLLLLPKAREFLFIFIETFLRQCELSNVENRGNEAPWVECLKQNPKVDEQLSSQNCNFFNSWNTCSSKS